MAAVTLRIGGRAHVVACRDGEEAALEALGARLDVHSAAAARAAGGTGGERMMMFIALMLADDLAESEKARAALQAQNRAASPVQDDAGLETLAVRLERLADSLEKRLPNA